MNRETSTMAGPSGDSLVALIGDIYAAALDPGLWPGVLGRLCEAVGSKSAAFVTYEWQTQRANLLAAAGADPNDLPLYEHYSPRNPFMPRIADTVRAGDVVASAASVPDRELFHTEYFNDYMRRVGYHHNLAICVARDELRGTFVYPARDLGRPPFSRADVEFCRRLVPHFERGLRVYEQLHRSGVERALAVDVLDRLNLAVLVLDQRGRPLLVNRCSRDLLDQNDGLVLRRDSVCASHSADDRRLRTAIARAADSAAPSGDAIRVQRPSARQGYEVLVVPLMRKDAILPGAQQAAVAVFVSDPERRADTWEDLLRRLYALTPTEARTALLLLRGERVQAVAARLQVSANTARTHLKRIFEKTGARSQSDLVRVLLSGPALVRFDPDSSGVDGSRSGPRAKR